MKEMCETVNRNGSLETVNGTRKNTSIFCTFTGLIDDASSMRAAARKQHAAFDFN
jgi:hypothetical protein